MRGGRQGSYFFVLDAFMAAAILVFTVSLVYGLFLTPRESGQSYAYVSDYLTFLTATELRDYHAAVITEMVADGNITNTRNTIATQLLIFHNWSRDDLAAELLGSTILTLPEEIAINISVIDGGNATALYTRELPGLQAKKTRLVAKSLVYALIDRDTLYGPVTLQVSVWA